MITLLLKSSFVIVLLLAFYKLFLEKESFFAINRIYLLACLGLTFLLPFIVLPKLVEHQGYLTTLIESKHKVEKTPTLEIPKTVNPENSQAITKLAEEPLVEKVETPIITQKKEQITINTPEKTVATKPVSTIEIPKYSFSDWLLILYFFGVIVLSLNLFSQLGGMFLKIIRNDDKIIDNEGTIVNMNAVMEPCSFFRYIFINPASYDFDTYEQIIAHEKIHVAKGHTWDLLLVELAVIALWFNPFIWLFRKEVEKNIEYQTDNLLVKNRAAEKEGYQMNLLKIATYNKPLTVVTNYNQSLIKQRIIKMNSKQSNPYSYWKYAFILPLLFVIILILNKPETVLAQENLPAMDLVEEVQFVDLQEGKSILEKSEPTISEPQLNAKESESVEKQLSPINEPSQIDEEESVEIATNEPIENEKTDCEKLLAAAKSGNLDKVRKLLINFDADCMPYANRRDYENMETIHEVAENGGRIYFEDDNELILVETNRILLTNHDYDMPNNFGNEIIEDCSGITKAIIKQDRALVKEILLNLDKDCIEDGDDPDEYADLILTQKILRNGGDVAFSTNKMIINVNELVVNEKKNGKTTQQKKNLYEHGSIVSHQPNKSSDNDCKKLIQAVREQDLAAVKTLLQTIDANCVDPNPDYEEIIVGKHTWRNRIAATPLVAAAQKGNFEIGKLLIDNGAKVKYHKKHDPSPLMAASESGNLEFVKYLMAKGADLDELTQGYGTALNSAAREGHTKIAAYLIAEGADLDAINNGQGTALNAAARNGHLETAKLLIEKGADLDLQNNGQGTALNAAARNGHLEVINLLVKSGADMDLQTNGQGSALNAAARNGHIETAKLLIDLGADLDRQTNGQGTALNAAARNGHHEMMKLLIDKGADIDRQTNGQGSALNAAARNGHIETVKLLIDLGADLDVESNGQGSALNAAARNGHHDVIKLLVEKGADIDAETNGQGSALNAAARNGHLETVKMLIDLGADLDIENNGQGSALHAAARNGHFKTAKYLIDKGADVNISNNGQGTPLIQATRNRHYKVVELLLENGADPFGGPRHQASPMKYAREEGNERLIELFKKYDKSN